jgi:glutamyl-tRNA reductase
MSVLAVGISHRSADLRVLEQAALPAHGVAKVLADLMQCEHVAEALVVATCNRLEVYTVVGAFHGGLADVVAVLSRHTGLTPAVLHQHLYVHYADAAVDHLFSVTAGLDSMVIGESQILGQVRTAYSTAREAGTVGRTLHELVQQALRVGKRVHAETDLDHAGGSVVSEALADAEAVLGTLAGRSALVVGAGAMGGLAVAALRRAGIGSVVIANRTKERGERLAKALGEHGIAAEAVGLDDLGPRVAGADLLVACTGSVGAVVHSADVPDRGGRPLVVCDLGLPRDVEPGVAALACVTVVDLESLQRRLADSPAALDTRKAAELVFEEVRGYLAGQRSAEVTPTVTALRKRAAEVVDRELLRLDARLPGIDERTREELTRTVRRVVDKLLHTPTVRVKQLAADPAGASYADALRELFALDPQAPAVLTSMPEGEER